MATPRLAYSEESSSVKNFPNTAQTNLCTHAGGTDRGRWRARVVMSCLHAGSLPAVSLRSGDKEGLLPRFTPQAHVFVPVQEGAKSDFEEPTGENRHKCMNGLLV